MLHTQVFTDPTELDLKNIKPGSIVGVEYTLPPEATPTLADWVEWLWALAKERMDVVGTYVAEMSFLMPGAQRAIAYLVPQLMDPRQLKQQEIFGRDRCASHNAIAFVFICDCYTGTLKEGETRDDLPQDFNEHEFDGRGESLLMQWESTAQASQVRANQYERRDGRIVWGKDANDLLPNPTLKGWLYRRGEGK